MGICSIEKVYDVDLQERLKNYPNYCPNRPAEFRQCLNPVQMFCPVRRADGHG